MTLYNLAVLWFIMWLLFGSDARIGVRLTLWLLGTYDNYKEFEADCDQLDK